MYQQIENCFSWKIHYLLYKGKKESIFNRILIHIFVQIKVQIYFDNLHFKPVWYIPNLYQKIYVNMCVTEFFFYLGIPIDKISYSMPIIKVQVKIINLTSINDILISTLNIISGCCCLVLSLLLQLSGVKGLSAYDMVAVYFVC